MPAKGKVRDLEKELDEGVTRPYEEIFCIVGMRADGSEKTVRISRKELLDVLARRAGPFWGEFYGVGNLPFNTVGMLVLIIVILGVIATMAVENHRDPRKVR